MALNQDSQEVALAISKAVSSGTVRDPSLLVWGYRPDLFAYTNLPAGTPYLDSQLLTGVIADRHLTNTHVSLAEAAQNRLELPNSHPTFIVDGLGPLNPACVITEYLSLVVARELSRVAAHEGFGFVYLALSSVNESSLVIRRALIT